MVRIPEIAAKTIFSCLFASALFVPLPTTRASGFSVVYAFKGGSDGANPEAGLTADASGNLYGTTLSGGGAQACINNQGCGTVFKLAPDGPETVLYSSQGWYDTVGSYAPLLLDAQGNLFDTTYFGGSNGRGSAYELAANGTLTLLHSFAGGYDGQYPYAGLIMPNNDGTLYGVTSNCCEYAVATLFSLTTNGTETVLYYFCSQTGCKDGNAPVGNLIADRNGNLVGTTLSGGANNRGVIYRVYIAKPNITVTNRTSRAGAILAPALKKEAVLWSFGGAGDGATPYAGALADAQRNFYGTTLYGGTNDAGTVYELSSNGQESVLYAFTGGSDGGSPYFGNLIMDGAGNLYGTTYGGGAYGLGTVFEVAPDGTETVLHAFQGAADGKYPYGGLVALNGVLYGTASYGGANGFGVIFSLPESSR